jgi:hypothetical protein
MEQTLFSYDARCAAARDNPHTLLPCCYDSTGAGCEKDATHWVLSRYDGPHYVTDRLPAEGNQCPPTFCAAHAAAVAMKANNTAPVTRPMETRMKGMK